MTTINQNTATRRHEVRLKYDDLFWRQPNVFAVSEGRLRDGRGGWLTTKGINISVTTKVDQVTLPTEDRIPSVLEGIPINIVEEPNNYRLSHSPMTYHRPLVSGISFLVGKSTDSGIQSVSAGGTLTGLATRTRDNAKVLVTNMHCVTGQITVNPTGDEGMYQYQLTSENKVGTIPTGELGDKGWVEIQAGRDNIADVAMFVLDRNMQDQYIPADFKLYGDPHSDRWVLEGVKEPDAGDTDDSDDDMALTMVGSFGGEGTVWVTEVNRECLNIGGRNFSGMVMLDSSHRPIVGGDSGSGCFFSEDGVHYYLSCIVFGTTDGNAGNETVAFPASVAQRELGITFGKRAPTASAGVDQTVNGGDPVTLDGSGSSDPDGDALTYSWEQISPVDAQGAVTNLVTLSDMSAVQPTFTAPTTATTANLDLGFRLTVTHPSSLSATADVTVGVRPSPNRAPTAVPGWNQAVPVNAMVTLTGSAEDPDAGHVAAMTYTWTRVSGPTITLSDPNVAEPTFTPTAIGDYVFKLTVTDPDDLFDEANVTIHCCSATGTSQWYDTGEPGCHNNALQKHQTQVKDGVTEFQWVDDPDNEVWGNWGYTGYARNLVMGDWVDTDPLETTGSGENRRKKQSQTTTFESGQERTSECGNTETRWEPKSTVQTRWIDYPETGATPPTPSTWVDTGQTRNRVEGPWSDTGRTQQDPVDDSWEKEQTRTVTWEKEQIDSTGNVTEPQWISVAEVETQWIPLIPPPPPPPSTWVDTGQTRNRVEGPWSDTGRTQQDPVDDSWEKEQTRTVTWEKEQIDSTGNVTEPQWISVSEVETQWIPVTPPPPPPPPPPPVTHSYRDITPAVYSGCGPNRRRKQECTRLGHEDTNWRDTPEPFRWGRWYNTGHTRNRVVGSWTNTSTYRGCGPGRERKQTRTTTWEKDQERQSHCGNVESRWVSDSSTDTRWVSASEPLRWTEWTDTGRTREHPVELIVEKEQQRTSHCGDTETRWVIA